MSIVRQLRQLTRSLVARPLVPALVVLLLAFGVGANTAIFAVARATLLTQLPYPNAERLIAIWQDLENRGVRNYPSAPADIVDFRQLDSLEQVAGMFSFDHSIVDDRGQAHKIRMAQVTDNLDETLGIRAARGRLFEAEDALPADPNASGDPVAFRVVLSHETWRTRFGEDPDIVGRTIQFGAGPGEVIGVLPARFRLHLNPTRGWDGRADVLVPYQVDWSDAPRSSWFLTTVASLAPGATLADAQAQLSGVEATWWEDFPVNKNAGTRLRAVALHDDVTSAVRPALVAIAATAFFLLLVACVNIASLLLVRGTGRSHELSIRAALGGNRRSILGTQLLEILVLAAVGCALGVVLARATLTYLLRWRPAELVEIGSPGLDPAVVAFACLLSVAAAAAAASWPAIRASRPDVLGALRGQVGRSQTPHVRRALASMVVVQVALTTTLLVGGVLMLRSVRSLQSVELGFDAAGVLTFETSAPSSVYAEPAERVTLHERLEEELRALPGVSSVGATSSLPLASSGSQGPYGGERELADNDEGDLRQAYWRFVSPGYFETLGTPLLSGRSFSFDDERLASGAFHDFVVVDRTVAQRSWPAEASGLVGPGERLYVKNRAEPSWNEVVGVVENQRQALPFGDEQGTIYFPGLLSGTTANWVVRNAAGDAEQLTGPVRDLLARIDPGITLAEVEPLEAIVARARAPVRFTATLIGGFGILALVLAACGLWGVLSYSVAQQRAELGIRMALGADRERLLMPVLRRAGLLTGLGVAVGALFSVPAVRLIESQLVGVSTLDAASYLAAGVGFLMVGLLAALGPALRASRLDPSSVLRPE